MSLSGLFKTAVIAGAIVGAYSYLTSPKEIVHWYLNWDIHQDTVVRNHLNQNDIYLGSWNGSIPLESSNLSDKQKQNIRATVDKYFNEREIKGK